MGKRVKPVKAWDQYVAVSAGGTYLEEVGPDPARLQKDRPTCTILQAKVTLAQTRSEQRIRAAERRIVEAALEWRDRRTPQSEQTLSIAVGNLIARREASANG